MNNRSHLSSIERSAVAQTAQGIAFPGKVTVTPQQRRGRNKTNTSTGHGDVIPLAEGLSLSWARLHVSEPLQIERPVPPGVLLGVTLAGEMHTQSNDGFWTMRNLGGHANFASMPESQPLRSDINMHGDFIAISLLIPSVWFAGTGPSSLGAGETLSQPRVPPTHAPLMATPSRTVLASAWQLLHPPHSGSLARLYQQSRGIDLLFGLLDTFSPKPVTPAPLVGKRIEQMYYAREILDKRLGDPPSIDELARVIGTNVRTLKQGFKACFGETVFGYVFAQRMALARRLLETEGVGISLVAQQVGYGCASNFTTAFRRHFGIPPSAMRRR